MEHFDYVVLVAFDAACAQRLNALAEARKLSERYRDHGVQVFLLNAEFGDELRSVRSEVQRRGLELPVLMEDRRVVLDSLGFTTSREAMFLRTGDWNLLWQGSVGGLSKALRRVVTGEKPPRSGGGICEPG